MVAEIFVLYPDSKYDYLEIIRDRYRFEFLPFGVKAAIEASDLIAMLAKKTKQPKEQWAKVKFDIQIAAIAKAEAATILYADDKGVINNAKRLKIDGKRICDLPLPPEKPPEPAPPAAIVDTHEQGKLFPARASEDKDEEAGEVVQAENSSELRADVPSDAKSQTESPKIETPPTDTLPIRGTNGGRAEGEASGEGNQEDPEKAGLKPCECGCGEYPKDPKSRFLPGHDLRKAYSDQKQVAEALEKPKAANEGGPSQSGS